MNSSNENGPVNPENRPLFLLFVFAAIALGWILLPFYGVIMWGAIIAVLFSPLNRRLMMRLHQRRTLAALLTLVVVLVIVILPFILVTGSLAYEAGVVFEQLQSGDLNPERYF